MLVRFAVQNYLSFNERTEFNMLTGSPRRLPHHVYHHGDLELLKMAAVYGANGAGKSNFVDALTDFKTYALFGSELVISIMSNNRKFRLNNSSQNNPIIFEIEFIIDNEMFFYSLVIDKAIIIDEKLLLTHSSKGEELIFNRTNVDGKVEILFNDKYKKTEQDILRIKLYEEELLKDYETLLSKLNESKEGFELVKKAYLGLFSIKSIGPEFSVSNLMFSDANIFNFIKDYTKRFNTGVDGFEIQTFTFEQFFGENYKEIKDRIKAELSHKEEVDFNNFMGGKSNKSKTIATIENGLYVIKKLSTFHLNKNGDKFIFDTYEESDGSVRLWDILVSIYFAIHEEGIILIDEIERSIHPNLIKELITKFSEHKGTKGQLIFTTHESNLLDQEIFRQDEIWFAEKNTEGATEMYPMSDFDVRYDLDVRKGYLNGRFGAIPFLSDFKNLNWKANA